MLIWRISILASSAPALAALLLSRNIGESAAWSENARKPKRIHGTHFIQFFRDIRNNKLKWRISTFIWISGAASTIEVGTFAFFIPTTLSLLKISGLTDSRIIILLVYAFGIPAVYLGPKVLPRIGLRKLSLYGYGMTIISLLGAGFSIVYHVYLVVPGFMLLFVWGNHWNNQPILTSQALVSEPGFRGEAAGFSNFVAQMPSFLSITALPVLFGLVGLGYSTLLITIAPLTGLLASIFLFRESFGYQGDFHVANTDEALLPEQSQ